MERNSYRIARWLVLVTLLVSLAPIAGRSATALAQSNSRNFPQTGMTVEGRFLQYWDGHGGLPQQGYPISDEHQELSQTDGKSYTVQYFERAVFELHPENQAPYDVLLSLLGTFQYKQKYPNGAPGQTADKESGAVIFKETGHTVGGTFLAYWQSHGGLAQQGFPISDQFQEKSDLDGKVYTVQYFERAVFEYHPENKAPFDVLLSQLGTFRYNRVGKYLQVFEQVWRIVRDNYVYTDFRGLNWPSIHVQYAARIQATGGDQSYAIIADMINKLNDHHSGFLDPQQAREEDALENGSLKLSGIGATLQQIDNGRRVVSLVPGGPAERAGLRIYDVITAVDGKPLTNDPEDVHRIRGPEGTRVTLTVTSPGQAPRDVTIVRAQVTFAAHATAQRLPGTNTVYLDLPTFLQFGISAEVRDQLMQAAAAGPVDGLIINVRQNGGGFIAEEINTEAFFIDGGVGGYSATRTNRTPNTIPAGRTLAPYRGKPIVVLVSGLCESACEHFTVAMHDLQRAKIMGTTTAGNTETVYPYNFDDGSRLMLAQAVFQRPNGSSIEDKGFTPDVVTDVPWYRYSVNDDPEVKAAIGVVEGK